MKNGDRKHSSIAILKHKPRSCKNTAYCVSNQSDGIRETLPGTLIFIQETQDSVCSDGPSQH